jgi:hypothetical protein
LKLIRPHRAKVRIEKSIQEVSFCRLHRSTLSVKKLSKEDGRRPSCLWSKEQEEKEEAGWVLLLLQVPCCC